MIRTLSDVEMEQTSGGFHGQRAESPSNIVCNTEVDVAPQMRLQVEAALMAAQRLSKTKKTFRPDGHHQGQRYPINQNDGVHQRWESYRPQQPAFRSRFLNR